MRKMSTKNILPKYDMFEQSLQTTNWEIKYQQLLAECLNDNNFELNLKVNMYLIHFMGEFVKYAKNTVKEIIDDLFQGTKIFNLTKYKSSDQRKLDNYYIYEDDKNKTSVKIAWSECKQNFTKDQIFYEEEQLKLLGKGYYILI